MTQMWYYWQNFQVGCATHPFLRIQVDISCAMCHLPSQNVIMFCKKKDTLDRRWATVPASPDALKNCPKSLAESQISAPFPRGEDSIDDDGADASGMKLLTHCVPSWPQCPFESRNTRPHTFSPAVHPSVPSIFSATHGPFSNPPAGPLSPGKD